VWDLRYPRPLALSYDYSISANTTLGGDVLPQGPLVLPGRYQVVLSVDGKTWKEPLTVKPDPRDAGLTVAKAIPQQVEFALQVGGSMQASYAGYEQLQKLHDELQSLRPGLDAAQDSDLIQAAEALATKAEFLQSKAPGRRNFRAINSQFASLATELGDGDRAPPAQYREVYALYAGYLKEVEAELDGLQKDELAKVNALLKARGKPPLG
jgi:hypothetical protein